MLRIDDDSFVSVDDRGRFVRSEAVTSSEFFRRSEVDSQRTDNTHDFVRFLNVAEFLGEVVGIRPKQCDFDLFVSHVWFCFCSFTNFLYRAR